MNLSSLSPNTIAVLCASLGFAGAIGGAVIPLMRSNRNQNRKLDRIEVHVDGNLEKVSTELSHALRRVTLLELERANTQLETEHERAQTKMDTDETLRESQAETAKARTRPAEEKPQ